MKKLLSLLLVGLVSAANAGQFHCTWNFTDHIGTGWPVYEVQVQTIASFGVDGTNIITGDRISRRTDGAGSLTISNLFNGRSYRVSFMGKPYQNIYGQREQTITVITNNFDTNVTGLVSAVDYLALPLIVDSRATAYSQAQADARFLRRTNDTGTNLTFRGTTTFPATGVSNYVWTATNSTGAGFWAEATGGGDVSSADLAAATNSGLRITLSQILESSASSGQVPKWNGSAWVPDTDLNSGGGSGITVTNGSGTNTTLLTADNHPDASGPPALTLRPLEKQTVPGGAARLVVMEFPYTNANQHLRLVKMTSVATNALGGETNLDFIYTEGFNYSAGVGTVVSNQPGWVHQRESTWNNNLANSQFEDWWSIRTPYTEGLADGNGTNFNFRYGGFNVYWNKSTKAYVSSDGNFQIGAFEFISPLNGLGGISFSSVGGSLRSWQQINRGIIITETNDSNIGGFNAKGGSYTIAAPDGVTASTTIFRQDWNNQLGIPGNVAIYPGGSAKAFHLGLPGIAANLFTNVVVNTNLSVTGKITTTGITNSGTTDAIVFADSNGNLTELAIGTGLDLSSGTLSATGGGGGVAWNDVTSKPHVVTNGATFDVVLSNSVFTARGDVRVGVDLFVTNDLSVIGETTLYSVASANGTYNIDEGGAARFDDTLYVGDAVYLTNLTASQFVATDANKKLVSTLNGSSLTGDDEAYDATGWNGDTTLPTKNAVRDKMELLAPLISPSFTTPALGVASGTSLTLSSLTSGRVPFATTSGLLTDDSALRWNNTTKAIELGVADTTAGRLDMFGDNDGNSSGVIAMLADSPSGEDRMVFTNAGAQAGFMFSGGPIHTEGITNVGLTASQFVVADANKKMVSTLNGSSLTNLMFPYTASTLINTQLALSANANLSVIITNNCHVTNWPALAVNGNWFNVTFTNSTSTDYRLYIPTNMATANLTNTFGAFVDLDGFGGTNWSVILSNRQRFKLAGDFSGNTVSSGMASGRQW